MTSAQWLAQIGIFVVGLMLLMLGAESLVRGAARIARSMGISSFIVGLTVVAFGTSAPELGGSLQAAYQGNPDIAVGNVVGSNIANICLILGMTAIVNPIPVTLAVVRREVPMMILVSAVGVLAMVNDEVGRLSGVMLVTVLAGYVLRAYFSGKHEDSEGPVAEVAKELDEELIRSKSRPLWFNIMLVLVGLVLLVIGSKFLIDSSVRIAEALSVPSSVIGLTMIAFGTSVPELATSVVAALRKQSDIAVGNVLGSNVFNILCVLGITAVASPGPLTVPADMLRRDAWVMLGVAIACVPVMLTRGKISRAEGAMLLGLYVVYNVVLYIASLPPPGG
ncbi:MAG: calcium/sodium antiporter [Planctomycetota bacterium]